MRALPLILTLVIGYRLMVGTGTRNGRPATTPSWPKSDARPSRYRPAQRRGISCLIAVQAEMKILKLEGENAAQRAVLRRREEEKAAVQRRTRDVALLSAAAGRASCW